MDKKLKELSEEVYRELEAIQSNEQLEGFRLKFLSRKGAFAQLFEEFKLLPKEEKPKYGQNLNKFRQDVNSKYDELEKKYASSVKSEDVFDYSLPGRKKKTGSTHIITQTMDQIVELFKNLGFNVHEGPELESDYNNFEALNFPEDHPARDMQDTFFVNPGFLLRTHTSPVQIRLMQKQKPPIRAIMPGKVYRNEAISAKSYCLFHQIEGLYVDKNVTFAELKGTLVYFAQQFFGQGLKYRFRPSFFPFTEPSAEMDIWWETPEKGGRWLEILGCGMVDPNVLRNVGIDPEIYTGYAFGMGVERTCLSRYGMSDIRTLFDNDKRFLVQF